MDIKQYTLLNRVNSPEDLKQLKTDELAEYCSEVRSFLVHSVSETGGHLASSLGVVELTVALHRIFNSPTDKIVWDVGHQSYVHKLITGRKDQFSTLRQEGGISGFCRPSENPHDAFISGHSSTSLSAALGLSVASKLKGEDNYTIAVVGDGAFTGGMVYEALNNAEASKNFIVILNHNEMSISKNVGGFARYLASLRSKPRYLRLKSVVEKILDKTPLVGKKLKETLLHSKAAVKHLLYHSTFFEDFGFMYLGPVDGHNMEDLTNVLNRAKKADQPVFIQVDTTKGKGYSFAEENPGAYHGVSKFDAERGTPEQELTGSFSNVFGLALKKMGDDDQRVCAVTAAMKYGTGLQFFSASHRDRFFDVGIAEEHALTFCCGLAQNGMIPVFAVYSTFLQRAYDQIIHDAAIENQHIVLAVDRAGIVGNDGETHQGIFDVSFLSSVPNTTVYSPSDYTELRQCLTKAVYHTPGVAVVRYPKGKESGHYKPLSSEFEPFHLLKGNGNCLIVVYGRLFDEALHARQLLRQQGADPAILKLCQISPLPKEALRMAMSYSHIFFFEEGIKTGGAAEQFAAGLMEMGYEGNVHIQAIPDRSVPQSSIPRALCRLGLDGKSMAQKIVQEIKQGERKKQA